MQDAGQTVVDKAARRGAAAAPVPAWSGAAARDRLSSTAFLAALLHGILILGITFGADEALRDGGLNSMEVVLVTADYEDREPAAGAVLLAQRTLAGAGNAAADAELRTAPGVTAVDGRLGPVQEGSEAPVQAGTTIDPASARPVLLARDSPERAPDPGEQRRAETERRVLPAERNAIELVGHLDQTTLVPDEAPRELFISANTRESRIAAYLNTWKRKVEQVGTLNFPLAAGATAERTFPVLEVAISADGRLRDVILKSSSGRRELDQAAMEILRLASPFEPFPAPLKADYDVLRFAYEWRFSAGAGAVRARTAAAW